MEVSKVYILAVRTLHQQASTFIENKKFHKCQTFSRPNPILVGRFYFGVFTRRWFNWGWRGSFRACDRYHFRWIPPSDVNSHVVTDGSDLWPIY